MGQRWRECRHARLMVGEGSGLVGVGVAQDWWLRGLVGTGLALY